MIRTTTLTVRLTITTVSYTHLDVYKRQFSSLDAADQAQVMRLVRKGDLVLEYKAKDKKQIKTEKWYRVNQEGLKELQPSARAKKRLALKEHLLLEQGEQPLAGLYQDFSREVVAYFIDQGEMCIRDSD